MNTLKTTAASLLVLLGSAAAQEEPPATNDAYHDNVVIVLDASGSMKQPMRGSGINKMKAAKNALKSVLRHLPETTHIGLLVFSASNLDDDWVYPLGPQDKTRLLQAIDRPKAHSGTPLGKYIKIGADRLLQARAQQYGYGTYRLLIVTDGNADDSKLVNRYTPEVLARGITIDVIGVDMKQDHTLAAMAHSYRRANDPGSLEKAIQEVFAELSADAGDFLMKEAIELIRPLPAECAEAALQALSTSGNHPIGENSRTINESRQSASAPSPPPRQTAQPPQTTSATPGARPVETSKIIKMLPIGLLVLGLLLVIAKKLSSSR